MLRILLLLLLSTMALAQSGPRTMYVTYNDAPLYDSASYMSTILTRIAIGDSVTMTGRHGPFARILYRDRAGYLLLANLGTLPPKGTRHAARPGPERDSSRSGSADTSDRDARPVPRTSGDTTLRVRCRGVTRSGKQCTRMTSDPSGYCWQHKGK
jgi:hypothetical protein